MEPKGVEMGARGAHFANSLVIFRKTADMQSDRAGSIRLRVGPPKMSNFLMFFLLFFEGEF